MKTIFRVAKTELRTLFYSPIAWFLIIIFLIQCGVNYINSLESIARQQDMGGQVLRYLGALTNRIFLTQGALFDNIMGKLYLYIPLLTMGLISREISSGTIKLLYSSPIKVREVVFGKFLSMMIYSLVLLGIIGIFIISGLFNVQFPETGILMSAMLGFYLLLCAYSAIGLFMSCLTTYQVVAAVSTFVMIGILSYIGSLWQDIAFVRSLTNFLSIAGRTQNMLGGLITTQDVIYFCVIIYIFLGLSIYKLKAGMESKPAIIKAGRYIFVITSALLIGYISSMPSLIGYFDVTANKSRTLTPNTQRIIKDLGDEPLEITAYNNLLGQFWFLGNASTYNQSIKLWEPYMRFKQKYNLKLNTVLYYDNPLDNPYLKTSYPGKTLKEIAQQYSKSMKVNLKGILTPEEIRKVVNLKSEQNRYVMQLKWKGRTTFLRVFDDPVIWPTETEIGAAFKRLQQAKLPRIGFITGNLERDINRLGDKDYKVLTNLPTFRYSLMNQGFDVDSVSLEDQKIPTNISMLVLADPKIKLTSVALAKLEKYIDLGGNLLIAGEPGKQEILNPLLKRLGVQLTDGMVLQESKEFSPDMVTPEINPYAGTFSKTLARNIIDSVKVTMPGVTGLSYTNDGLFNIHPLLTTDPKRSWKRKKTIDLGLYTEARVYDKLSNSSKINQTAGSSADGKPSAGVVTFNPADGDKVGPITTALALTRNINGKEQRIVITADADFISNAELSRTSISTANFSFSTELFSWLNYGEFPIDTSRPPLKDNRVNVTPDQVDFLRVVYIWIVPGILLIFSTILLLRRKRK